jgi:hypothetical protein
MDINDIKRLPDLYIQKKELENQIDNLEKISASLESEAGKAEERAKQELKKFESVISAFHQASFDWWTRFFNQNSPDRISDKIKDLKADIAREQQRVDEGKRVDNREFIKDVQILENEIESNKSLQDRFSIKAGYIARKAMLYDVCLYVDNTDWTLKKFNNAHDWGLHLCPNGISSSLFKIWFMISNPFGYFDLKKAVEDFPSLYGSYLTALNKIQSIIKKRNVKNLSELKSLLAHARSEISAGEYNIGLCQKKMDNLRPMESLVSGGQQAFLNLKFDEQRMLYDYKEEYRKEMSNKLSKLPNYQEMKTLCDDVVLNVFDYKNVDNFANEKRLSYQRAVEEAPREFLRKREDIEKQLAATKEAYDQVYGDIEELQDNYENILIEMTKKDPASTFFYQAGGWINKVDEQGHNLAVEQIEKVAEGRNRLEPLPVYKYLDLGGKKKAFLSDIKWQTGVDNAVNLICKPLLEDESQTDAALWATSNLITSILLSMPIGKVHFTFIDYGTVGIYSKLLNRLNRVANLYSVVHNGSQLSKIMDTYQERTKNADNSKTEVIVWTDCISDESNSIKEHIKSILQNGAKYGYYTIAVPLHNHVVSDRAKQESEKMLDDYHFKSVYVTGEDFNSDRSVFIKAAEEYVRKYSENNKAESIYQECLPQKPMNVDDEGLRIPIGKDNKGREEFYQFDIKSDYPHTFILGGSGSGKTNLLHNILLNGMLKYKSNSLELYLMDLKKGGTDFHPYKDKEKGLPPHISHLLLDDADHQAVYEIMYNLKKKMGERGRMIAEGNYEDIVGYNKDHQNDPMPYIMLVVDECHKLFDSDPAERKMQDDINGILREIASEGRSQGITFIFATQTFAGMAIPDELYKLIGNRYLMKVKNNEDAEKLFVGGSIKNSDLSQGFAYNEAKNTFVHIYKSEIKEDDRGKACISDMSKARIYNQERIEGRNKCVYSGKDVWSLPSIGETGKNYPIAYIGKSVSVERNDMMVPLMRKTGNNMLITGINDELQAERVFFSSALSLAQQTFNGKRARISIFDNPGDQDDDFNKRESVFNTLESLENVRIFRTEEERLAETARLGNIVRNKNPEKEVNILLILAQEQGRSLLWRNLPAVDQEPVPEPQPSSMNGGNLDDSWRELNESLARRKDAFGLPDGFGQNLLQSVKSIQQTRISNITMQDELQLILSQGGESDVHIVMQVNSPDNILEDSDSVRRNDLKRWFNNIVILRSSQDLTTKLPVNDIRPDRLNSSSDLLRAIYVDNQKTYQNYIFTPYQLPKQ